MLTRKERREIISEVHEPVYSAHKANRRTTQEEARRRVRRAVRARAGTSVALHQSLAQTHRAQSDEGRVGTHYSVRRPDRVSEANLQSSGGRVAVASVADEEAGEGERQFTLDA